jgi:hypothetical protein
MPYSQAIAIVRFFHIFQVHHCCEVPKVFLANFFMHKNNVMSTNWEVIIIQFEKSFDDDNDEELFRKWTLKKLIQTLEDKRCKQGNNKMGCMENL